MTKWKSPAKVKTARPQDFDVVIVGGGLAGLSLACLLGGRGLSVACADQADLAGKNSPDLRTTAVSFGSRKILERAGIWDKVQEACPIEDIRILDGRSPVLLKFLGAEAGSAFGWITDNAALKRAMMARLAELPNVQHIAPAGVAGFEPSEEAIAVLLEDGRRLQARLVVGADGRQSFTRQWMGVPVRQWSYGQRAVICAAAHEHPHHNVAVEHFWPEGPFAILPMVDGPDGAHRSSVVFTEHGRAENSWMRLSDSAFEAALSVRFPPEYGAVRMIGRRVVFPLGLVHAAEYIRPRMALAADAAHGIHPIAGQGLNLGFRDLDELDRLVGAAFAAGEDIGSAELLETYQRRRRPDNMAMVAATDALVRLFSNDFPPVALLRRAGLRLVSRIKPARLFFMKQAMGDRGR